MALMRPDEPWWFLTCSSKVIGGVAPAPSALGRARQSNQCVGIVQFVQAIDDADEPVGRLTGKRLGSAGPAAAEFGEVLLAAEGAFGAAEGVGNVDVQGAAVLEVRSHGLRRQGIGVGIAVGHQLDAPGEVMHARVGEAFGA